MIERGIAIIPSLLLVAAWSCAEESAPMVDSNRCLVDVAKSFAAIPEQGASLIIHDGDMFSGADAQQYSLTAVNNMGIDNHFQGVQRKGRYLFLTGGDIKGPEGHIFIIRMGSRADGGAWGSNVSSSGAGPAEDKVVARIKIPSANEWHAGGASLLGDILAVPTENTRAAVGKKGASIRFWDVSNAEDPHPFPHRVEVSSTAHAAGLIKLLSSGKFLLVNWNDRELTFYLSRSSSFGDGFPGQPSSTWGRQQLKIAVKEAGQGGIHGQAINLVQQCDGKLFALMGANTFVLPVDGGKNYIDLYQIEFPLGDHAKTPTVTKVGSRILRCPAQQGCNFSAAAGAYVDSQGGLLFYSVPHFRDPTLGVTRAAEFAVQAEKGTP